MVDGCTFGNFDEWIAEHDKEVIRKFVDWLDNGPYLLTKVKDVWCGHYFGAKEVEVDFNEVLAKYEKERKEGETK